MERHTMRVFGIVALSLIFVGIAFAQQADDFVKLDKVTYFRVSPSGSATHTATDNTNPALTITQSGTAPSAVFTGGKVGIGTASPSQPLDIVGNMAISGTARRIIGDFSNATHPNRLMFQTSAADSYTFVSAIPSGTGTYAGWSSYSTSDPSNASFFQTRVTDGAACSIDSRGIGSKSPLPIVFQFNGTEKMRLDTGGSIGVGTTSPTCKLDISENSGSYGLRVDNAGDSARGFGVKVTGSAGSGTSMVTSTSSGYALTFGVDSVEKMRLNNDGNVGIGTSSPSATLQVQSGDNGQPSLAVAKVAGNSPIAVFYKDLSPVSEAMRIDRNGNIGVGTASPSAKVHIADTLANQPSLLIRTTDGVYDARLRWDSAGVADFGTFSNYPMRFLTNSSEKVRIDTNGNVGIGTSSPSNKLHIQGSDSSGRMAVIENTAGSGSPEGLLVLTSQNGGTGAKFAVGTGTVGSHTKNFVVTNAGNVGVGTATPVSGSKLNVVGGDFVLSGGVKNAEVETASYGKRRLYSMESAEVRFYDEGKATLVNGKATIKIDPIFAETIEGELNIHLTPYGPVALYVEKIEKDHFEVHAMNIREKDDDGQKEIAFVWMVSASRKGYADRRLAESVPLPEEQGADNTVPETTK